MFYNLLPFLFVTSLGLNILCAPNDKSKSWILSEFKCLFHLSIYETECFNIYKQKSQVLSYSAFSLFVTSLGFKPRTSWAVIKYSIQLSYEAKFDYKDNAFFRLNPKIVESSVMRFISTYCELMIFFWLIKLFILIFWILMLITYLR